VNRRKSDHEDAAMADEIMRAIAECEDQSMKAVLLIIHSGFGRLSMKIDAVLQDESAIKSIVLNGHTATFHDDMDWLHNFRTNRPNGKCPFVLKAEAEALAAANSKRKISENIMEKLIVATITALLTMLGIGMHQTGFF
jgi:hypothetical protein